MLETQSGFLIHVAGVTAVWLILLSSIRFAAAGAIQIKPVARAYWHFWWCRGGNRHMCRVNLTIALDRLHDEFFIAFTTPWSVTLLFGGMALVGGGLALGSVGDVVMLVSRQPTLLNTFDRLADCACAGAVCTGMAMMLAATSKRRRVSTLISLGFAVTGVGVGIVTAV